MRDFRHLLADFTGVPGAQLRDGALLSGLMIAAAGAAGFTVLGTPLVRQRPSEGVSALLLLEDSHIAVHTYPQRELLLLDVLATSAHDPQKAVEVFARRIAARQVVTESRARG